MLHFESGEIPTFVVIMPRACRPQVQLPFIDLIDFSYYTGRIVSNLNLTEKYDNATYFMAVREKVDLTRVISSQTPVPRLLIASLGKS